MFSSDVGHWDVPDMTVVLEEAYENVEKGWLDKAQFRDFVFGTNRSRMSFAGLGIESAEDICADFEQALA